MILIDANNLCHISYHSTGELSNDDIPSGVMFGFLRNVLSIATALGSSNLIFCWDSRKSYRKLVYKKYKSDRNKKYDNMSEEEKENRKWLVVQMQSLYEYILPELGFRNNFKATGFEADDLIAKIIERSRADNVIVSTDKDFYQLISDAVLIFNPITKKTITEAKFKKEYKIDVKEWITYKALIGDKSDSIEGIKDIGDKRAVSYLTSERCSKKIIAKIESKESKRLIERNESLIKIPFDSKHLKPPMIRKNKFHRRSFIDVFDRLRFISFLKEENFIKWEKTFNI